MHAEGPSEVRCTNSLKMVCWVVASLILLDCGVRTGQVRMFQNYFGVGACPEYLTEWQIIDQAVAAYSRVTVSLYDTLGPDVV